METKQALGMRKIYRFRGSHDWRRYGLIVMLGTGLALNACDDSNTKSGTSETQANFDTLPSNDTKAQSNIQQDHLDSSVSPTTPTSGSTKIMIDWEKIDAEAASGTGQRTPMTTRQDGVYPFALDSKAVKDYASFHKLSLATAQHNLTVGTASNEALLLVLDQLDAHYRSHRLTDDDDMTLIIYTSSQVIPSSHDYVIQGEFGRGLVLPIRIESASE